LFAEYRQVAQQLSAVTLSPPLPPANPAQIANWKERELELRRHWESEKLRLEVAFTDLEKQISQKSALFAQTRQYQQVTSDDITAALRQETRATALVDLVVYGHEQHKHHVGRTNKYRIAAFVGRPDRDAQRVELGVADPILDLISVWRRTFGASEEGRAAANQLRKMLWQPMEPKLEGIDTVLISSDGALSQFPWNALPGSNEGRFLIEERSIAMIPIPQFLPELLQRDRVEGPPESLLLAGDVDYSQMASTSGDLLLARTAIGRHERSGELRCFSALNGAKPELNAIHSHFTQATLKGTCTELTHGAATEEAFRQAAEQHPWLHIVTHGFFAPETIKSALQSRGNQDGLMSNEQEQKSHGPHPGTLSGLAFAGANNPPEPGKDDGILTALEVSALDLRNVNMVVLSACETGLGEVAGGEGLLGLQRAFQVAGAKTCVASLWSVHDAGTRVLMERFYDNLWQKKMGKLEALREAQLWALRNPKEFYARFTEDEKQADAKHRGLNISSLSDPRDGDTTPPYYWAPFVLSGDWR
jgi:CHAT domain-containing protein